MGERGLSRRFDRSCTSSVPQQLYLVVACFLSLSCKLRGVRECHLAVRAAFLRARYLHACNPVDKIRATPTYLRVLVEPAPAESPDELPEDGGRGVEVDLHVPHRLHHLDGRLVCGLPRAVHDDDLFCFLRRTRATTRRAGGRAGVG